MPNRPAATTWQRWFDTASLPCYVLDRERRIRYTNESLERLLGQTFEDLSGIVCDFHPQIGDVHFDKLASSLAAPPVVWQGEAVTGTLLLECAGSQSRSFDASFIPLSRGDVAADAVLVVLLKERSWPGTQHENDGNPEDSTKPWNSERVSALLRTWVVRRSLVAEPVFSRSIAMQRVVRQIEVAQGCSAPVLFSGGPGTGKEFFARELSKSTDATPGRFVPVDCQYATGGLQKEAFESFCKSIELKLAAGGTVLFFRNVEWMPIELQHQVSQFIFQQSSTSLSNVSRLIAGTRLSPSEFSVSTRVIPELRAVFSVFPIQLPALIERGEDLVLLAQYFAEVLNAGSSRQWAGFSEEVWTEFRKYHWPGNVSELRRIIKATYDRSQQPFAELSDLPTAFRMGRDQQVEWPATEFPKLDDWLEQAERELIMKALKHVGGSKTKRLSFCKFLAPDSIAESSS